MDRKTDGAAFSQAIAALALSFDKEAGDAMFEGYWLGLSDLPLATVQRAVAIAIRQCQFMPRPVELRRFAGEQTSEQRAISAWADVQSAIPRGPYKHIDFDDKLINAAIRSLGGWPVFVSRFSDEESEKWARLDFLKTYEALAGSGVNGEACLALPGLSEKAACGGELQDVVPLRIGCSPERRGLPSSASDSTGKPYVPVIEFHRA